MEGVRGGRRHRVIQQPSSPDSLLSVAMLAEVLDQLVDVDPLVHHASGDGVEDLGEQWRLGSNTAHSHSGDSAP